MTDNLDKPRNAIALTYDQLEVKTLGVRERLLPETRDRAHAQTAPQPTDRY